MATVPRVRLGRSGLVSSRIGLGTANWIAKQPDDVFLEVMCEAFRLGVRHLDTAPSYDQERFARLLAAADPPTDVLIVTKVGRLRHPSGQGIYLDFSAAAIERTVELNLRQLGLSRLPVVLLHDLRPEHLEGILGTGGALAALRRLQAQGLIGAIGVAAASEEAVARAAESGEFDVIQSYHLYTLLNRAAARRIFPAARRHDLGVVNLSPFAGNILATGTVEGAVYSYRPATEEVFAEVRRMESAARERGVSLPIAALTYALACSDVHVTVIGPVSVAELREDVAALEPPLSVADLEAIAASHDLPPPWQNERGRRPGEHSADPA